MFIRSALKIILFFSHLISVSACVKTCVKDNEENFIRVALAFPVETLDPRYSTSHSAVRLSELIYGRLFDLQEDLSLKPFLAESFIKLDDRTFKITLRKGLYFHDGTPLSSADIAYTFSELGSKDVSSPFADKYSYIDKIELLNDWEAIFHLKHPYAGILTDVSGVGIVSKKSCKNRSHLCRDEHNGSGPFRFKSWDKTKELILLEPFKAWFEGPPQVNLLFSVVRDETTRLLEIIGKKTDLIEGDISPQNITHLKRQEHLEIREIPGLGYSYLAFNVRGPKPGEKESDKKLTRQALANQTVRKAIAHAIDFNQIIERVYLGTVDRVSGLLPNTHWAKDKDLSPPHFDPKLAKELLDEAGFIKKSPSNKRFKVVLSVLPIRLKRSLAQIYADFLQKVDIDATVRVKDWSALYQDMKQGNFEIFSASWVPVVEPDLYYWVHHSNSIPHKNIIGGNRHGYKNSEIDNLIEKGRHTFTKEERIDIYKQIEKILLIDLPYIPLWNERRIVVHNQKISNFFPRSSGSLLSLSKSFKKISYPKALLSDG